jgi:hypothetical protein
MQREGLVAFGKRSQGNGGYGELAERSQARWRATLSLAERTQARGEHLAERSQAEGRLSWIVWQNEAKGMWPSWILAERTQTDGPLDLLAKTKPTEEA